MQRSLFCVRPRVSQQQFCCCGVRSSWNPPAALLVSSRRWCAASASSKKPDESKGFLGDGKKEKLVSGAIAATASCTTVIGVCHLVVCQVPATVALGSISGAALTGALGVFEGDGSGGSGFGSVIGVFLGLFGAYYAKSSEMPWAGKKK